MKGNGERFYPAIDSKRIIINRIILIFFFCALEVLYNYNSIFIFFKTLVDPLYMDGQRQDDQFEPVWHETDCRSDCAIIILQTRLEIDFYSIDVFEYYFLIKIKSRYDVTFLLCLINVTINRFIII